MDSDFSSWAASNSSVHLRARVRSWAGEDDLGGLLADRRAARDPMAGAHVAQGRAHQPAHVDAAVLEEAAVLHRDEGGGQVGRHLVQVQALADDRAAMADLVAVLVQEGEGERAVHRIEVGVRDRAAGRRRRSPRAAARAGRAARLRPAPSTAATRASPRRCAESQPPTVSKREFRKSPCRRATSPNFGADSRPYAVLPVRCRGAACDKAHSAAWRKPQRAGVPRP